jgi:uncharacterized protein YnzC (UPF0291/DUF896 family)
MDLSSELKTFDKMLENARALAVVGYAQGSIAKQRYLRQKYVSHLQKEFPEANIRLIDIEGDPIEDARYETRADYADEEAARTSNITNHTMTEDERLDDPRHEENK